ncbi:hypothetical protein GBA52_018342 [Prunus armeniaca]|nr:hypothetical protein GBA52_018342 [Prunus armeniaca]
MPLFPSFPPPPLPPPAAAPPTLLRRRSRIFKTTSPANKSIFTSNSNSNSHFTTASSSPHYHRPFLLRVTNDSSGSSESERREAVDRIVDGIEFGELCNEFECISSPSIESTARQLVRDILELREGNRALGTFAVSVQYKDPVRSFSGRDKYKRPLWITTALHKPSASVQEMSMLSTSVLSIKWTVKGKPKNIVGAVASDLIIRINSQFTLNQISGQVIEHKEFWDLSASSAIGKAYFWTSRRLFATIEGGKDLADLVKTISNRFPREKQNMEIYPDPSGDPTKFFQRDDGFQRDVYQIALFLALVYFVVQLLRTTL